MATKFKTGVDNQGQRSINAADGSAPTDLATVQQMQAFIRGLDLKDSVVAASTGNVTLASPGASMDGVTLANGNRVLLKNQSAAAENGVYVWSGAASPLVRAADMDASAEVSKGMSVTVVNGLTNTVNATTPTNGYPTTWVLTTDDPIVLGTTALVFVLLGGGSAPYVAGNGLSASGQTFNVGAGNGTLVDADTVYVDPSVVVRKYAANCAATTNPQVFTHGLGSDDVDVSVFEGNEEVVAGITKGVGTVTVDFGSAPSASQYRVVIKV